MHSVNVSVEWDYYICTPEMIIMYMFEISCCNVFFICLQVFSWTDFHLIMIIRFIRWSRNFFRGGGSVDNFVFGVGGGLVPRPFFREFYYANLINLNFPEGVRIPFRSAHEVRLTRVRLFFHKNIKACNSVLYKL